MGHCEGFSLEGMVRQYQGLPVLHRTQIRVGDMVYVKTMNSVYQIRVEEGRLFSVSGGWFDHRGNSPAKTTIADARGEEVLSTSTLLPPSGSVSSSAIG